MMSRKWESLSLVLTRFLLKFKSENVFSQVFERNKLSIFLANVRISWNLSLSSWCRLRQCVSVALQFNEHCNRFFPQHTWASQIPFSPGVEHHGKPRPFSSWLACYCDCGGRSNLDIREVIMSFWSVLVNVVITYYFPHFYSVHWSNKRPY